MEHAIRVRGLAKPEIHRACSFFPSDLRSLHEYLLHYQSGDSRSHEWVIDVPLIMLTIGPRILTYCEYIFQSLFKHMMPS